MKDIAEITFQHVQESLTVTFSGTWNIAYSLPDVSRLVSAMQEPTVKIVIFLEKDLIAWDTSLLALLVRLVRQAKDNKLSYDDSQLSDGLQKLLAMVFRVEAHKDVQHKAISYGLIESLENAFNAIKNNVYEFLDFFGEIVLSFGRLLRGKADIRAQDIWSAIEECGLKSLSIVAITSLLFGLILAFVGAIQLIQFGAERFVAPLVGIGVLRVMGAVMVGIVMSGRIGAAYAALIGTMQVNEEIDALKTLGFSAIDFLVLPRVLALICMAPLLTLYSDIFGMLGGFFVGIFMLGLSPQEYVSATVAYVPPIHIFIGLAYGTVFGCVIAIAGCYQGIRCGRSAAAVGQATTAAVVTSIVGIIIATAIITIICNALHI